MKTIIYRRASLPTRVVESEVTGLASPCARALAAPRASISTSSAGCLRPLSILTHISPSLSSADPRKKGSSSGATACAIGRPWGESAAGSLCSLSHTHTLLSLSSLSRERFSLSLSLLLACFPRSPSPLSFSLPLSFFPPSLAALPPRQHIFKGSYQYMKRG
eukprot:scaffold303128_cov37-Tisochrysis_lutea.AAC.2